VSARVWLLIYAAALLAATLVHDPYWLGGTLLVAVIASGRDRWRLVRRTVCAVVMFNGVVSLGYALVAGLRGEFSPAYLLLINLRVLLMVYLGFWFVSRVNLLQALAFSPTLSFLATLACGQGLALKRMVDDYQQAFRSRNLEPPDVRTRLRHAATQGADLLDKALHGATETTQAMRSRGFFNDPA
jgi:cobalt/nickel transport system permease protein